MSVYMFINQKNKPLRPNKATQRVQSYENTPHLAQLMRVANSIGEFMHYWGFKRIHGQVWTLLFLSDSPLSGVKISQQLKVSKALISLVLHELQDVELIVPVDLNNKRIKAFRAQSDVMPTIRSVLIRREMAILQKIQSEFLLLKKLDRELKDSSSPSPLSSERISDLDTMIVSATQCIEFLTQITDLEEFSPILETLQNPKSGSIS